jgi:DNA polymerase
MSVDSLTRKWVRTHTYGGKLVENIVQAVARDMLAEAMFRVEEAGYKIVMHVHDEILSEVPEGFGSVKEFEDIMAIPPKWAEDCPIGVEGWRGKRYRK